MSRIISRARLFRNAWRDLFRNSKFYRWCVGIAAFLVFTTFLLPLYFLSPIMNNGVYIPLHYNIYFGVDRFGPWYQIFVPPTLGLLLLLLNIVFESYLVKREHVLSTFFVVSTVLIEMILCGSMILIVWLNT